MKVLFVNNFNSTFFGQLVLRDRENYFRSTLNCNTINIAEFVASDFLLSLAVKWNMPLFGCVPLSHNFLKISLRVHKIIHQTFISHVTGRLFTLLILVLNNFTITRIHARLNQYIRGLSTSCLIKIAVFLLEALEQSLRSVDGFHSHITGGEGSSFIRAYLVAATHSLRSLKLLDKIIFLIHLVHSVSKRNSYSKGQTFRYSSDNH